MQRVIRPFLRGALAVLLAAGGVVAAESARSQPNVLVILTDDMRWDALGVVQRAQGREALFPWFPTPHLDRVAAEGARFANVFVTTSLCSPSRASLLSGQYAHRHRVLNNFTDFPHNLPSYPRRLQDATAVRKLAPGRVTLRQAETRLSGKE